jgi:type II secretory pathway pseudopilin PulG
MKQLIARVIHSLLIVVILILLLFSAGFTAEQKENEKVNLDQSEEVLKQYIASFAKTGIPTPKAIEAAIKKAQSDPTIKAWEDVATIANSYANVIDVLSNHYAKLYYASRSG